MIAHAGGLPVEEVLPALMGGGGAWLILRLTPLRAWLRPARHRSAGTDRQRSTNGGRGS